MQGPEGFACNFLPWDKVHGGELLAVATCESKQVFVLLSLCFEDMSETEYAVHVQGLNIKNKYVG